MFSALINYGCERREPGTYAKHPSISTEEFNARKQRRKAAKKSKRRG